MAFPWGKAKVKSILNITMQGTVWRPLQCTATMDKLAQKLYKENTLLYKYKNSVSVPPLEMIDDIMTVQKCGATSLAMNNEVNAFIEQQQKLRFSQKKCDKIHVGKTCTQCENCMSMKKKLMKHMKLSILGTLYMKMADPTQQ